MKNLIKKIYNELPFKKHVFSFVKNIYTPPSSLYQHLHFKGVFSVRIDERSFKMNHYGYQLENEIFWEGLNGGWEKNSIEIWKKLSRRSRVIFDIGANTGIFSLISKTVNPGAQVYAFEPVRRVFDRLVYNVKLNKYDIECINKAVSNNDGVANIYDSSEEHVYSASLNEKAGLIEAPSVTRVETITLDTFIQNNKLPCIDLVKIDVEKFEPQVMAGFLTGLKKFRPAILIEILDSEIGEQVSSFLKDTDYLFFHIDEVRGLQKTKQLKDEKGGRNYLLCTPAVANELHLS